MNKSMIVSSGLIVFIGLSSLVFAGNIEPPAGPNDPASAMYSIEAIYQRLSAGTDGEKRGAGFREPTGPPGSGTMHNLNDVMAKAPSNIVDAVGATTNEVLSDQIFWGLTSNEWGTRTGTIATCTLSPDTNTVDAGYYVATNLSQVDTDLASANIIGGTTIFGVTGSIPTRTLSADTNVMQAGYYAATNLSHVDTDLTYTNIRVDVTIFGVTGTVYEGSVPKTGCTTSEADRDDGALQKGVAWPVPRFTINTNADGSTNGTVTDNLTGLMWSKCANICGKTNWGAAVTNCNELNLTNYCGYSDWRLPNINEMFSLITFEYFWVAVPDTMGTGKWSEGDPFDGVHVDSFDNRWTSTAYGTIYAWLLSLGSAQTDWDPVTDLHYVWPVRGP